jgi:hypothetical protein
MYLVKIEVITNNNPIKRKTNFGDKMKKIVSVLFILTVFSFIGCEKNGNDQIVSPQDKSLGTAVQPNWIVLPAQSDAALKKDVSVSKLINGSDESLIEINTGYKGGPFGWVSITANARFQRNSFTGQKLVTMSINDQFGASTFTPSGTFTKPVIYNLTIMGVDLSNVNPSKVIFAYLADDGKYYAAKYQQLFVEKQSGKLQVINAELPHFSRYAFAH